jgi:hypothetical protein
MVTFAVADDEAFVPASVVVADDGPPPSGVTVTVTVVPTGMLAAPMLIVTGFVVLAGKMRSGVTNEAAG